MTDDAAGRRALLRQESVIAMIASAVIGLVFFLLIFGWQPVERGALAIDCLPQVFGITMLGGMVPSLITMRRIARGKVMPAGPVPTKTAHLLRVALCGLVAVVVLGVPGMVATWTFAPPVVDPLPAMAVKSGYGALVGYLVTPPILRMVLGMPLRDRRIVAVRPGVR